MPKSGTDRAANYENKIDPVVVQARIAARKATMVAAQTDHQSKLAALYLQVRQILDSAGVDPIHWVAYNAFAHKLYGLQNRYGAATNTMSTQATYEKTRKVSQGLSASILHDIAALFGVSI